MLANDARDLLLSRMRELIERWGWRTYVAAPVLEPTDRYFPDPHTPDLAGLRTVARRMSNYVGLGHLEIDVYGAEQTSVDPLAQTHLVMERVDERGLRLGVFALGVPEEIPLVLAHEVARAYRELRSGPMRLEQPYRGPAFSDGAEPVPDGTDEEEVSLTACYLGFGLFVAIGAHRYKVHGQLEGTLAVTRWVHHCLGALRPDEAAFLLAAQAVVRDIGDARLATWRGLLSVNVRKDFSRFVRDLRRDRPALLDALGLPEEETWPEAWDEDVEPFEEDDWQPEPVDDEAQPGHPVFRVPADRGWSLATLGGVVTLVGLIGVPIALDPAFVWGVLIGGPALCVGLYFGGKRLHSHDTCTVCEIKLLDDQQTCPECGGVIVGTLEPGESHMAACERVNVATTHEGLLAEKQDDADPRYVELGVKCPTCAWIPDGEAHWSCEECESEPFNTFEHGGECPACSHVFEQTWCPRCEHVAPYDWWWPATA